MDYAGGIDPPEDVEAIVETEPVYNLDGWQSTTHQGPQCSAAGEFCFMCTFRKKSADTPEGEPDDVKAIDTLITTLGEEGKEIPLIVQTVYDCYEKHIRDEVRYTSPITGMQIDKPEWSTESIQRHIVFSGNYGQLFDSMCNHIFTSTIMNQQNRLVDKSSGAVIEQARRGLMDTFKHFREVRRAQGGGAKRGWEQGVGGNLNISQNPRINMKVRLFFAVAIDVAQDSGRPQMWQNPAAIKSMNSCLTVFLCL